MYKVVATYLNGKRTLFNACQADKRTLKNLKKENSKEKRKITQMKTLKTHRKFQVRSIVIECVDRRIFLQFHTDIMYTLFLWQH